MYTLFNNNRITFWFTGLFVCLGLTLSPHAAKVAEGSFSSMEASIKAEGMYEIHEAEGKWNLVIKSNFKVSTGPDLFFVFHPLEASKVTSDNAKTLALKIDPGLKSFTGAQEYALPENFNLEKYNSLLVHCWSASHLFATASIQKVPSTNLQSKRNPVEGSLPGIARNKNLMQEAGAFLFVDPNNQNLHINVSGQVKYLHKKGSATK